MLLAKNILQKARYILSDTAKDRWTDERLLTLLNDAVLDVAKNTTLFVEDVFYVVTDLVVDIDLSSKSTKILAAEYLDETLPFYTFEEMEQKYGKRWQFDKGDKVKALVYGRQPNSVLKQYPIVENSFNPNIVWNSLFGIVTNISYSDIEPVLEDFFGDIASIPDTGLIKFYYIRRHELINDINMQLKIDDLTEQPIAHYIAGMALRDNQDTQNRNMGTEELQIYAEMVDQYSIQKSQLFVRANIQTQYRPLG